jgi:hypothetical protein
MKPQDQLPRLLRKRDRAIRLLEARLQDPEASASLFSVYRNLLRDQEAALRAHLKDEAEKPIDWAAFMAAHPVPQDNPPPAPFPSLLDPPMETPAPSFSPGKIFGFLLPILFCLSASLFPARIHAQAPESPDCVAPPHFTFFHCLSPDLPFLSLTSIPPKICSSPERTLHPVHYVFPSRSGETLFPCFPPPQRAVPHDGTG